jgi:hypothetical protein
LRRTPGHQNQLSSSIRAPVRGQTALTAVPLPFRAGGFLPFVVVGLGSRPIKTAWPARRSIRGTAGDQASRSASRTLGRGSFFCEEKTCVGGRSTGKGMMVHAMRGIGKLRLCVAPERRKGLWLSISGCTLNIGSLRTRARPHFLVDNRGNMPNKRQVIRPVLVEQKAGLLHRTLRPRGVFHVPCEGGRSRFSKAFDCPDSGGSFRLRVFRPVPDQGVSPCPVIFPCLLPDFASFAGRRG